MINHPVVDKCGNKHWYNDKKELHREDGPAIECVDGHKEWYINNICLFIIDKYGAKYWYNSKKEIHREDGPAIECSNGTKYWYINGKLHRENGPAIEAVEYGNIIEWYINGKLHRKDGPAKIKFGDKFWYINGLLHREDGPAIEYADGYKSWYLDGKKIECETQKEFDKIKKLLMFY